MQPEDRGLDIAALVTRPAMSNPNGLMSKKLSHFNQGRTLNDMLMRGRGPHNEQLT